MIPEPEKEAWIEKAAAEPELSTISLAEEKVRLTKRKVETGRVRVSTYTETTEKLVSDILRSEDVELTRVAFDRPISDGEDLPQVRVEGDLTIIPVIEEILFVEKRLVLKEELHLRRVTTEDEVEIPVTLRRQHALVERVETSIPDPIESKDATS
ncbi:YsnF/AvaK domain-containing protein [Hansschlegelia quercus]|uniref:YsnF/AvaK domain-containing protein n=1 Tax=Hansschlegelia quercus TaxID=2528245 RepID=UPI001FDEAC1C|nr:YsnF/AvaK domain-containing protein [Hansschlegelia quercus]